MAEKKVDNFSRVDAALLKELARRLPHGFVFAESKEGAAFWYRIQKRLNAIATSAGSDNGLQQP